MQIVLVGEEQPVPARPGDTILESLLRAGVPFPFSRQSGHCGACKCADEEAKGLVLACRAQLFSDALVRLAATQP